MKIAMIGTAPGSRAVAPIDDPEWKIWACSQGNQGVLSRIDAWFELHPLSFLQGPEARAWVPQYIGWLRSQTFPVYMQEKNDLLPQAIVFPFRRMLEVYCGPGKARWFTSSVAWMMAFAISQMKAGDTIGLFGIDMAHGEEHYTAQRAGCHRFIEIARERGIEVTIPHESCLGQPAPLYGYSEATLFGRKMYRDLAEMEHRRAELAAHRDRLSNEINFADGAIERQKYIMRTFLDGADAPIDPPELAAIPSPPRPATTGDVTEKRPSGLLVPKGMNGADHHARED